MAKMKLILIVPIFVIAILLVATSAARPSNDTPGNSVDQSSLPVWKDPEAIRDLKDVLFDFDTHESAAEQAILEANARWLKDHPDIKLKLAGYTDPRGDLAYNLALSQRRANTVKQDLLRLGVSEDRIVSAVGWGELYPNCSEATEECWKENRRVEFVRASE